MIRFILKKALETKHLVPIAALLVFVVTKTLGDVGFWFSGLATVFLGISIMSSVHHAEIIAHKIGEGLGTLVLALSVTIIEVGLILSLMGHGGEEASILARDTVFAAVMIVTNGIVAICLILGGLKFKEQEFQVQGSKSLFVVLIALSFLVFVLPNFTTSSPFGTYSKGQMGYIACALIILYVLFVIFQTKTHKSYFEPAVGALKPEDEASHDDVTATDAWLSFLSLCVSLVAVIGLAKILSPTIEKVVVSLGAPKTVVGLLIALIVLLPESWAAVISARANRLQTSLNLALGSGIASIALTIPFVIIFTLLNGNPLTLGLDGKGMAFMFMTFAVGTLTLGTGKSTLLQGAVHGIILLTYFVMAFIP